MTESPAPYIHDGEEWVKTPQIGHCRDCRWWEQTCYSYPRPGWGECELTHVDNPYLVHEESLAYNGWDLGKLYTAPNFGCVQFAAKDAE